MLKMPFLPSEYCSHEIFLFLTSYLSAANKDIAFKGGQSISPREERKADEFLNPNILLSPSRPWKGEVLKKKKSLFEMIDYVVSVGLSPLAQWLKLLVR